MRPASSLRSCCLIVVCFVLARGSLQAEDFLEFGENLAEFGVASQSSQLGGFVPENALDGDFGNFTHTQSNADFPDPAWWQVDLLDDQEIGFIAICNRTSCCGSRLRDIVVEIMDADGEVIWATTEVEDPEPDELLNPENEQGSFPLGPTSIFVDVMGLNGGNPVSGQIIRVNRLPDDDLSGSGGQGNNDEATVLQIGEFGVFEDSPCADEEGDSHCVSVEAEGPAGGDFTGLWTFTVNGDDDSGDPLRFSVRAEHTDGTVVSGGSDTDQVVLDLQLEGTWAVSATVDDSIVCSDEADDATCEAEIEVVERNCPLAVTDVFCEFGSVGFGQGVKVSWTNPNTEGCCGDVETEIQVDGETVRTVPGDATSVDLPGGLLPPDCPYAITVVNCSGFGASCSPCFTDELGLILTHAFLALGPISTDINCADSPDDLLGNHIAPSFIGCEYPSEGEETLQGVDFTDPANVANGFHPDAEEVWRRFNDGTPADGDQNLDGDIAGNVSDHVTWLATYIEYQGDPADVTMCIGHDDDVQVWLNERLLLNHNSCHGRGDCDESVVFSIEPGTYRLAIGTWENGGGWGCRVGFQDEFAIPVTDDSDDWIFHGAFKPEGVEFPPCSDVGPVEDLTCGFDDSGNVEVTWNNPGGAAEIVVSVQGEEVETLPVDAEGVVIDAGDLPDEDPLNVCVNNGAALPVCCNVSANIALGKPAAQSSQLGGFDPGRAVDGDFGNFHHTNSSQAGPAVWEVDLEDEFTISKIVLHNRGDGCCQSRFRDLVVSVHDGSFLDDFIDSEVEDNAEEWVPDTIWEEHSSNLIWQTDEVLNAENQDASPQMIEIDLEGEGVVGQFVRVTRISDADSSGGGGNADEPKVLQMGEVEVFGSIGGGGPPPGSILKPGDTNSDGSYNIADAVAHLNFLFGGGELAECFVVPGSEPVELAPPGLAILDFNGDGSSNIADAVGSLNRLFGGGDGHVLGDDCAEVEPGCASNCQ